MKPAVAEAIEDLKRAFPCSDVTANEDGQGGAYVVVETVHVGSRFEPVDAWMGGHIPALYPYADIYPVFIDATVRCRDGRCFEVPITEGHTFCGRPALQISRRNNRIHNSLQTAVAKFLKIIYFLGNV